MIKLILTAFTSVLFVSLFVFANDSDSQDYANRIEQFKNAYRAQFNVIYPTELEKLGFDSNTISNEFLPPALGFLKQVEEKVNRLVQLHDLIFVQGQRDKALSAEMNLIESNLVFISEVGLRNLMHILLDLQTDQKISKRVKKRLQHLGLLTKELSSGNQINSKSKSNLKSLLDIRQTLPKQMLRLGCSYVASVCLGRKPIGDWLADVGEKGYSQRNGPGFETHNFEASQSLPKNAIVVVVANHQDGALDVALPNRLGQSLGLEGGLKLLAHSSNYPFVQHMNKGDHLLFTDRGDWQAEAVASFDSDQNQNRRIGVIVYPEGLVSGPLSQFPLITKVGALSSARKWSAKYAGQRPVYLAVLTTNAHTFSTENEFKPLQVRLESLEQVPFGKPQIPDSWIETQRERIQDIFNRTRDQKADLELRIKTPNMHGLFQLTQNNKLIQKATRSCRGLF